MGFPDDPPESMTGNDRAVFMQLAALGELTDTASREYVRETNQHEGLSSSVGIYYDLQGLRMFQHLLEKTPHIPMGTTLGYMLAVAFETGRRVGVRFEPSYRVWKSVHYEE